MKEKPESKIGQIARKIEQMREELPRLIDSSYNPSFIIDVSNEVERRAFERGRACTLFEALAVIDFLQAVIKDQNSQSTFQESGSTK